jgi:hypothetical protein
MPGHWLHAGAPRRNGPPPLHTLRALSQTPQTRKKPTEEPKDRMLLPRRSVQEAKHGAMTVPWGAWGPLLPQCRTTSGRLSLLRGGSQPALERRWRGPHPTGLLAPCRGTAYLTPRRTGPRLNSPSFARPVAFCTFLIYWRFDAAPSCPPWGRSAAQQLWAPRQLLAAASIAPSAAC